MQLLVLLLQLILSDCACLLPQDCIGDYFVDTRLPYQNWTYLGYRLGTLSLIRSFRKLKSLLILKDFGSDRIKFGYWFLNQDNLV